jgi:hypothetical protein
MGYTIGNLSTTAQKQAMGEFQALCSKLTTHHSTTGTTEETVYKKTVDLTGWDYLCPTLKMFPRWVKKQSR